MSKIYHSKKKSFLHYWFSSPFWLSSLVANIASLLPLSCLENFLSILSSFCSAYFDLFLISWISSVCYDVLKLVVGSTNDSIDWIYINCLYFSYDEIYCWLLNSFFEPTLGRFFELFLFYYCANEVAWLFD